MSNDTISKIDEEYKLIVDSLAEYYVNHSMFGKAVLLLRQLHEYNNQIYGISSDRSLDALYRLGVIQLEKNDIKEAERTIGKMEKLCKSVADYENTVMWAKTQLLSIKLTIGHKAIRESQFANQIFMPLNHIINMYQDWPDRLETALIVVEAMYLRALCEREHGLKGKSEEHFRENVALCRELETKYPGHITEWIAHNLISWGGIYKQSGNINEDPVALRESEKLRLEAYGYLRDLYERRGRCIRDYALCCNTLGNIYRSLKEYEKSLKFHQETIALRERLYNRDPKAYSFELAMSYQNYAHLLSDMNELDNSLVIYDKAIALLKGGSEKQQAVIDKNLLLVLLNQFDTYCKAVNRFGAIDNLLEISMISSSLIDIRMPNDSAYQSFVGKLTLTMDRKLSIVKGLQDRFMALTSSDIRGNAFPKLLGLLLYADKHERFEEKGQLEILAELYQVVSIYYMNYIPSRIRLDIADCFEKLSKSIAVSLSNIASLEEGTSVIEVKDADNQ